VTYLLHLVLAKVRDSVYYNPWQRPPKVKEFVHDKGHDAGRQDIIAHPCVPCKPELLEVVELHVVFGDLLERTPVGVLRHWRQDRGCVPVPVSLSWIASRIYAGRTSCLRTVTKRAAKGVVEPVGGMKEVWLQRAVKIWRREKARRREAN
jgi:hypothetical protein